MINDYLTKDHRHCDELFAQAEALACEGNHQVAEQKFNHFSHAMEQHFHFEENRLFPKIEQVSGNPNGPTNVMRMEHEQIRTQMQGMALLLQSGECEGFLDHCDSLLILMQQHNLKEESILYPMADQLLRSEAEQLINEVKGSNEH